MNVFILSTGRCGSTTFASACDHISNFTSAHESRTGKLGADRFAYPDNHIESDNRLSWFLGKLDKHYGDDAVYVHLTRDARRTAESFAKRYSRGIISAYRGEIIMHLPDNTDPLLVSMDYVDTVNTNIDLFLKDKTRKMRFELEHARDHFIAFWNFIGAEGDLSAALSEFDVSHNATRESSAAAPPPLLLRTARKLKRVARKLPAFLRSA